MPLFGNFSLQPHHIIYRSHGGKDTPENTITLCARCHDAVHKGCRYCGERITGREVILFILKQWVGHKDFRWQKALDELKKKPRR
jgi:hypothetical protein